MGERRSFILFCIISQPSVHRTLVQLMIYTHIYFITTKTNNYCITSLPVEFPLCSQQIFVVMLFCTEFPICNQLQSHVFVPVMAHFRSSHVSSYQSCILCPLQHIHTPTTSIHNLDIIYITCINPLPVGLLVLPQRKTTKIHLLSLPVCLSVCLYKTSTDC